MQTTVDFLRALWPGDFAGSLTGFHLPGQRTIWCETPEDVAASIVPNANCYFGVCSQDRAAAGGGRGKAETAVMMPAVWVDIDVAGDGHKGDNLAPTLEIARRLANATGLAPSVEIATGGGLQAYWFLDEPIDLTTDRDLGTMLASSWVATLQAHGAEQGYQVDSVGDLARVLRLPGSWNVKTGTPRPVTILESRGVRYVPSDLEDVLVAKVRPRMAVVPTGDCPPEIADIVATVLPYLADFRAEVYAEWISIGLAMKSAGGDGLREMWHAFSRRSTSYDPAQADEKWNSFEPSKVGVGSLIHKARIDSKQAVLAESPIGSAWQLAEAPTAAAVIAKPTGRVRIANVMDSTFVNKEGNEQDVSHYRPIPDIAASLSDATGGWPRRVGNILFSVEGDGDLTRPDFRPVQFLTRPDQFFAWMLNRCDVRWLTGHCKHVATGEKLIAPTKTEFFEYEKANVQPVYSAVELLPHYPEIRDVYYIPTPLPKHDDSIENLGHSPLYELINALNPETEEDRLLMLAAMLTPGWGGACGARPAFLFTSDHGRGVGKTQTASTLADLWGGCMTVTAGEDWDTVRKRLLGDDSMTRRVILIDNLKGKLNSGDIEGAITSKNIDGWKPYHGQASRPNRLTWFITANSPSLSRDLADRSIIIKVGKQKHGKDFVRWAAEHIEKHRGEILAELFEILKRDPVCSISRENRDRWQAWQDAILSRLDDGDVLAALIRARRPDVDADMDDADELAGGLFDLMRERGHVGFEGERIFISAGAAFEHLTKTNIVDRSFSRRACSSWLRNMIGQGSLSDFRSFKTERTRGLLYMGPHAVPGSPMIEIHELSAHG